MTGPNALRELLGTRDFRALLAVRMAGQAGDGLFQGALFGAAFFNPEKATSAAAAATAFASVLLPYSLVGPFAGVLLDRWSRQRVLLVSNALRALVAVGVAVGLARTGAVSAPSVTLALVLVSLNRFVLNGLSASLPHVVADRHLVTANAMTTTLGSAATAVGGVSSLVLRRLWGDTDAGAGRTAVAAALLYVAAAGLASRIARRRLGPDTDPGPWGEAVRTVVRGLQDGTRHLRSRPPAARALAVITVQRFFTGLAFVGTLLLYTDTGYLHRGFTGLGEVLTATVVGGVGAAFATPSVTRALGTQRWIVVVLGVSAVVQLAFGAPYTHRSLLVAGLLLGFCAQAAKICVDTLVQESVDDAFRGRVFSVYDMLVNVSFALAAGLAAVVIPDDGHSYPVLGVIAGGYALTALVYGTFVQRRASGEPPEPVMARA